MTKILAVLCGIAGAVLVASCQSNDAEAEFARGQNYYRAGNAAEAVRCWEKAMEQGYIPARTALGNYYIHNGEKEKGLAILNEE